MKKLESSFLNMVLVTTLTCLIAGGLLAGVYNATKEPIALAKKQKQEQAIKDVLPPYDHIEAPIESQGMQIYKAYNKENQFVGAAVESYSDKGFSGNIKVMVGFDAEGKVTNYSVLEAAETPGLGAKMTDWFKTDNKHQNVCGLNPSQVNMTVSKDGGDIDAITAATITSRAFLLTITNGYKAFKASESTVAPQSTVSATTETQETATAPRCTETCQNKHHCHGQQSCNDETK